MANINLPSIIINFKTYEQSSNEHALELAKKCEKIEGNIILCVDAIDLKEVANGTTLPVFAQHVDGFDYGGHTGKILPEVVKHAGAIGTLINHSEDRYDMEKIKAAIEDCKKEDIYSLVCAQTATEAAEIAQFSPDAIAIEPPELIGGDISVTTADPKIVTDTVAAVQEVNENIPVFCGAGVKNGEDVKGAIKLGTVGVLLASGITKAADPEKVLQDMIDNL